MPCVPGAVYQEVPMKKTFQLHVQGKHPERLLEAIKHEIRKYIKRERRRDLPEGVDFWDFDCKFGTTLETAEVVHLNDITVRMDEVAQAQGSQCYVEILAKHGVRKPRAVGDETAHHTHHEEDND
jgi:hypothetical protein